MCLSPHWCVLCKGHEENADHLFLHCPFSLNLWWSLIREVKAIWVIPKDCFSLISTRLDALGKGKKALILWGCLGHSLLWNIWHERNRTIFDDYSGGSELEIWERVKFWAALWASITMAFKDYSYSYIVRDLVAAVL
ncbi:hypothetical protein L3X38_000425 [Prunus dulcis]|uniref:Reverse transcriptase zinc-binding domain-containing protein n=1 Tax=Prunus dulcis TaxID=3755 RepID=A0AAD4WQ33_PRUDU|nr:hypothetical protein L3X38_000425 [Prunus dulcis]